MRSSTKKKDQKKVIFLQWIARCGKAISADELYLLMRKNGMQISITTVYRYLRILTEEGQIQMISAKNNQSILYRKY
ncbi:MAG: transcriptional repressor [Bacteroidota bacterium]